MMKRLFLSILIVLITSNFVFAQSTYFNLSYNPNNTWSGGLSIIEHNGSYYISGATYDSIYQDHNGGYIMCGFRHDDVYGMDWMNSSGWICKIDEDGDSIWWREYEHF